MKPNLKLVTPSPESDLAKGFALLDVLADETRDTWAQLAEARIRYARTHGLLMLPGWDTLRKVVGK